MSIKIYVSSTAAQMKTSLHMMISHMHGQMMTTPCMKFHTTVILNLEETMFQKQHGVLKNTVEQIVNVMVQFIMVMESNHLLKF